MYEAMFFHAEINLLLFHSEIVFVISLRVNRTEIKLKTLSDGLNMFKNIHALANDVRRSVTSDALISVDLKQIQMDDWQSVLSSHLAQLLVTGQRTSASEHF